GQVCALIDIQASIVVGCGIGGINRRIEVNRERGIQIADTASLIDMSLVAQVDSPLERVRAMQVGHVVRKVVRGQEARVAGVILQRNLHAERVIEIIAKRVGEEVEGWVAGGVRIGVREVEAEAVQSDHEFIQHVGINYPTPRDGQIFRGAECVHYVGKSRENG